MKIIAVFKTHVDIGFTDLPHKVLFNYSHHLLQDAVTTCEASQGEQEPHRFIWTMPAFPLYYALEHAEEPLRQRAEACIRRGQLVWHALPLTLRTEFFSRYSLEQTLWYAKTLCRRYGRPMPISAKMTDVPGHTMALVDVLAENGVRFLHLGCNPWSTTPKVPVLFWWESKTGNRVLTYYDKRYGNSLTPPADWPYPVHLAMCVTNDNTGVQPPGTVANMAAEIEKSCPGAQFTTGTMDDFAREILQCDLSGLPVIRGELGDTWIHGLGAFPESCAAIYGVRPQFEKICAFLAEKNDTSFDALQREYLQNELLFGEHSGGVSSSVYIGRNRKYDKQELLEALKQPQFQYAEAGWNDERGWAFTAQKAALSLQKQVEQKYGVSFAAPAVVGGTENAHWKIFVQDGKLCFLHKASQKTITAAYFYEVVGRDRIETFLNSYLRHRYDWALCDFGRYTMDGNNSYPPVPDQYFAPIPQRQYADAHAVTLAYAGDSVSVNQYGNAREIKFTATVQEDEIRLSVDIVDKQPTMYVESGHVCFDLGLPLTDVAIRKSGNWINPAIDIVPGANTALFAVDGAVCVNGLEIRPMHTPLVSFGESKIYRYNAGPYHPAENGRVCFNVFNNMWGTGAPQWIQGSFHCAYALSMGSQE